MAGLIAETTGAAPDISARIVKFYFDPPRGVMPKAAEISAEGMAAVVALMGEAGEIKGTLPDAARFVEGRQSLPDGSKVCIVEDTVTTGGSLLKAVERCRAEGLDVVQTLTIVDREEGGAEAIRAAGLSFRALVRRAELER